MEQACEPSIKSFLLPRLKRKGGTASRFNGWRPEEVPIFSFLPLQRRGALAKELSVAPHSVLGSGRPPLPEPLSYELLSASCLAAQVHTRK